MALGHSAFAEAPIASAAGVSATVAVSGLSITSALGSLTLTGTSNLTLNTSGQAITLVYIDATRGWAYKTNTA